MADTAAGRIESRELALSIVRGRSRLDRGLALERRSGRRHFVVRICMASASSFGMTSLVDFPTASLPLEPTHCRGAIANV